ncbi:MAG TPA: YceI family protein [Streptosporangiaceae bacterium]|nr:YceI family protein [Streptosporangiaceae bacterium]
MAATSGNFRLGPDTGRVVIKTGRAGLAAKAGHDLTIEVTRWSAQVEVPAESDGGQSAATVSAELDLGSLEVREGTGGAVPLTDRDRREIKKQMGKILGGGTATFASSRIIPAGARPASSPGGTIAPDPPREGTTPPNPPAAGGAIEGTVTLNGKTQPARLQVTDAGSGRYRGSVTLAQTGFGIKPYTGFFGALKLKDEVVVEFEVGLSQAQGSAG